MRPSNAGGSIRRAVVDHEDVCLRKPVVELVENRREVLLLVPCRDEHECVGFRHSESVGACRTAQITLCSGRGAERANLSTESGVTSTKGSRPSTRSRTISPIAGACMKPCPEKPVA